MDGRSGAAGAGGAAAERRRDRDVDARRAGAVRRGARDLSAGGGAPVGVFAGTVLTALLHTLNRNNITSPSCTTYSFPSDRTAPFSRAPFHPSFSTKSSSLPVSPRMHPPSKSLWITPAAAGAV